MTERRQGFQELVVALEQVREDHRIAREGFSANRELIQELKQGQEFHNKALEGLDKRLEKHDERQRTTSELVAKTAVELKSVAEIINKVSVKTDENSECLATLQGRLQVEGDSGGFWSSNNGSMALKILLISVVGLLALAGFNVDLPL